MSDNHLFVTKIDLSLAKKIEKDMREKGYEVSHPSYTLLRVKKPGLNITLYESGKLLVQGKECNEFVEFYLEPEILQGFVSQRFISTIGVDEAGKGDFFGPLCVSALYVEEERYDELISLGVKDSKKLSDSRIMMISEKIEKKFSYECISLIPIKYNELYDNFGNLNHLLAWCHSKVIKDLSQKTNCKNAIIDKFAHESLVANLLKMSEINLTQIHAGESHPAVAGASIIARNNFLTGIANLEKKYSTKLPKGASNKVLKAAVNLVKNHSVDLLSKTSKKHFKTFKEAISHAT